MVPFCEVQVEEDVDRKQNAPISHRVLCKRDWSCVVELCNCRLQFAPSFTHSRTNETLQQQEDSRISEPQLGQERNSSFEGKDGR